MYLFFFTVVVLSFFIFILKRRSFDFLSIYYVLLLLYNIPTLFGFVYIPGTTKFGVPNEYIYIVSAFPFIFLSYFLFLKQPYINEKKLNAVDLSLQASKYKILTTTITILFYVNFIYSLQLAISVDSKRDLLDNTNALSILLSPFSYLAIMYAYLMNNKKMLRLYLISVGILFFWGGRGLFAIAILCLLLISVRDEPIRIIKYKWAMLGGCFGLLTIVLGKTIYGYILFWGFADGINLWYKNFNVDYLITGSEFIGNTAILNEVIMADFSIPWSDVFTSLFSLLPIPVSVFGLNSGIFNEKFQNALFPGIEYGMAYNIWAEGYSWLGLGGVLIFSILIPFILYKLWFLYSKNSKTIYAPIIILIGCTIAFWCHRNSIGTLCANIRNILYPSLLLILTVNFIYRFKKK